MSNRKRSGKALVIQIDRENVRVAQMILGAAVPRIGRSMVLPTPEGAVEDGVIRSPEPLQKLLKSALSAPEWKRTRRVVFSLCTTQVISETASVPKVSKGKLGKLIETNLDMYFPVDVRDYHVVWEVVGASVNEEGAPELSVQLWAAPNALLMRYYALAHACGLSVQAVDWCGRSMASAADAAFTAPAKGEEPGDTCLYLLAEAEHLLMTFVRGGQVKLQRLLRRESGCAGEWGEAQMALEYYKATEGGAGGLQAVLCGSKAGEPGYADQTGGALNLPVRSWSGQPGAEWCLCVGASRVRLDLGDPAMNRPKGVGKQLGRVWQYGLLLAGGALLLGSLILTIGSRAAWSSDLETLEATRRSLQLQSAQSEGDAQRYDEYAGLYEQYSGDWDTLFGSLRTYNDNLALMLDELESVMPSGASVVSIGIADEGLGLQFSCSGKEEAAYLIIALRKLQYAALESVSSLTTDRAQGLSGQAMLSALTEDAAAGRQAETAPTQGGSAGGGFSSDLDDSGLQERLLQLLQGDTDGAGDGVDSGADGRLYFSVALGYQPALMQAELERKGLSYEDKLEKLEAVE